MAEEETRREATQIICKRVVSHVELLIAEDRIYENFYLELSSPGKDGLHVANEID